MKDLAKLSSVFEKEDNEKSTVLQIIQAKGIYSPNLLSEIIGLLHSSTKEWENVPWIILSITPSIGALHNLQSNMKVKVYRDVSRTFILNSNYTLTRSKRC